MGRCFRSLMHDPPLPPVRLCIVGGLELPWVFLGMAWVFTWNRIGAVFGFLSSDGAVFTGGCMTPPPPFLFNISLFPSRLVLEFLVDLVCLSTEGSLARKNIISLILKPLRYITLSRTRVGLRGRSYFGFFSDPQQPQTMKPSFILPTMKSLHSSLSRNRG